VYLPCDAGISGGFSRCFSGFFLVGFGLFGPGAARAPVFMDIPEFIKALIIGEA